VAASGTCVIDLSVLRRACGPIIACYERFLADGSLDVDDLDDALASLRVLPALEGRLGRAVTLVVSGGAGAPSEETVAALELLRTTTGLRTAPSSASPPGPPKNRGGPDTGRGPTQPPLPGLD
jgi:hypothetical protein